MFNRFLVDKLVVVVVVVYQESPIGDTWGEEIPSLPLPDGNGMPDRFPSAWREPYGPE